MIRMGRSSKTEQTNDSAYQPKQTTDMPIIRLFVLELLPILIIIFISSFFRFIF